MHFKKLCLTKMCSFTKWYVECILTYFYCDSLLCMLLPLPTMSLHVRSHTQAKNIFLWTKESNLNLSLSIWPLKICRYCNYYHITHLQYTTATSMYLYISRTTPLSYIWPATQRLSRCCSVSGHGCSYSYGSGGQWFIVVVAVVILMVVVGNGS